MSISAPYCTSGDVYLMRLYLQDPERTDFAPDAVPRPSVVETWIANIASQIDMQYAASGYEIPLTEISGEDWPTHQTTFLKYFNAVGVAALMGGDSSTPPIVQFVGGRRTDRSFYEYEWMRLISAIQELRQHNRTEALLRASTLVGTPADYLLSDPGPPLTDWLEGYDDPTAHDTLRTFTKRHQLYSESLTRYDQPTIGNEGSLDYLYLLHWRLGFTYDA